VDVFNGLCRITKQLAVLGVVVVALESGTAAAVPPPPDSTGLFPTALQVYPSVDCERVPDVFVVEQGWHYYPPAPSWTAYAVDVARHRLGDPIASGGPGTTEVEISSASQPTYREIEVVSSVNGDSVFAAPVTEDCSTSSVTIDAGSAPNATAEIISLVPARLLETRSGPGLTTFDGLNQGGGAFAAGETRELVVAGRGGVPADAEAVMVNVTAVFPSGPGYLSVFPCGQPPNSSSVNYDIGDVIPNMVLAKIGPDGKICIFTHAPTDVIVDVTGYVPATALIAPFVVAHLECGPAVPNPPTIGAWFRDSSPRPIQAIWNLSISGGQGAYRIESDVPAGVSLAYQNEQLTAVLADSAYGVWAFAVRFRDESGNTHSIDVVLHLASRAVFNDLPATC